VAAANEAQEQGRPGSWTRYLPLALLIALSAAAAFASYRYNFLSLERIVAYRDKLQDFVHAYGPMAVFGWLFGGAIASVSATLGAIFVFLIARTSVGDILVRKAGPRLQKFAEGFREDAFSYLLFLRFLPIMPFWMTNLAPALFGVRVETFALATMIGILPATFTFATAGAGLDSVIAAQKASVETCRASGRADCAYDLDVWSLLTPQILAAFAALGIMALIPVAVRHWRRRKGAAEPSLPQASTARPKRPNA
jgi:uncharacterized membrane protein YdjX (TVP38/TMEM64 family)